MRKSEGFDFPGLLGAILTDIALEYPNDAQEWDRDKTRLHSIADQEGIRFFTITLPAAGKHLDRCLSDGALLPFRLPHLRAWRRGGTIPGLFRALYARVFDDLGVLKPNPDIQAIRFLRQLLYVAKKVRYACGDTAIFEATSSFWEVERSIRSPDLDWSGDYLVDSGHDWLYSPRGRLSSSEGSADVFRIASGHRLEPVLALGGNPSDNTVSQELEEVLDVVQRVADRIVYDLPWFIPEDYRFKHGPGAVSDLKPGGDKYSFPNWPDKLEFRFGIADFAYANYAIFDSETAGGQSSSHSRHEPPSKLCVVPKTLKAPRLIASEPVSHQWCQQSLKDYLSKGIAKSCLGASIDFRRQELSQEAALQASRTGSHATIDLSEASDRLSCWLVERLFRSRIDLLEYFHAVRTRWLVNNIDKKLPKHMVLKKFSTMGSALTFPIQSMVFAMVAIGVRHYVRKEQVSHSSLRRIAREVRVFGDDIIVPTEDFGLLTEVLTHLGLKVNTGKSFAAGFFREACGMDAYKGVEVTPSYVLEVSRETRPGVVASIVETANNFFKEGYWRTAQWIESTLPDRIIRNLAVMPLNAGGLTRSSFCGRYVDHLPKRWNHDTQQWEYRSLTPSSKVKMRGRDNHATLLQYFTEAPEPDEFGILPTLSLGIQGRPKDRISLRWGPCLP